MNGAGVSIIICCFNSSERLPATIKHIAELNVPQGIDWEVVVVNNNSTDQTSNVALEEWRNYSLDIPFRVINENRSGLCYARETGIKFSRYDYILFCDDDNWLSPDYLVTGYQILEANDKIGMLGGTAIPQFDSTPPEWFSRYSSFYAVGPQGELINDITDSKGYVYGAGMFIRKSCYKKIKDKRVDFMLTGRKGAALTSGEDAEIGYLLAAMGFEIHWNPMLKLKHLIPKERLSLSYMVRMRRSQAATYEILKTYKSELKIVKKGVLANRVLGDFLDSFKKVVCLSILFILRPEKKNILLIEKGFHSARMLEILKNASKYGYLHSKIRKNVVDMKTTE